MLTFISYSICFLNNTTKYIVMHLHHYALIFNVILYYIIIAMLLCFAHLKPSYGSLV